MLIQTPPRQPSVGMSTSPQITRPLPPGAQNAEGSLYSTEGLACENRTSTLGR
jgi:hypothetical protein